MTNDLVVLRSLDDRGNERGSEHSVGQLDESLRELLLRLRTKLRCGNGLRRKELRRVLLR